MTTTPCLHFLNSESRSVPHRGRAGLAQVEHLHSSLRRPCLHRRRGTFRAAGRSPLQPGTAHAHGDRIPVPDGVERPRPRRVQPRAEVPTMSGALAQAALLAASPATDTPAFPTIADRHQHQQAAPHLRCGAAGVGAPVQARCSLSGEDCSRHPPNTPTSARGHRTSSVGGILLPDPPS